MDEVDARRGEYMEKVLGEFDPSTVSDKYDRKLWSINHTRLVLHREIEEANKYFETAGLDPRPIRWRDGIEDTPDWDFPATDYLRTLLQFADSPLLSRNAKENLKSLFLNWVQPRKKANQDNNRVAKWPRIHTENHDIMLLTIGLFCEYFAGRDCSEHIRQLSQSLAWRFERGWVEWSSPCYQIHYLNPLLILAEYAPDENLRRGANDLINLQIAERVVLSMNGYLGGPFYRGYKPHLSTDRFDSYLPVMWMLFGLGDPSLVLDSGVHFACSSFKPHKVLSYLLDDIRKKSLLEYKGTRYSTVGRRLIYYYNTPAVSIGSVRAFHYTPQSRYFSVLFAEDPDKSLSTYFRDPAIQNPWDDLSARGEVVQHKNWLISRGKLVENGGIESERANGVNLYTIGKGLCAHIELPDNLHIFQTSDLDTYPHPRDFLSRVSMPVKKDNFLFARTTDGERLVVNLYDMSLYVNGEPAEDWSSFLHYCPPLIQSKYGAGVIEIRTSGGDLILSNRVLLGNFLCEVER